MRWNSLALTVVFVGVIGLFHYWRAGFVKSINAYREIIENCLPIIDQEKSVF